MIDIWNNNFREKPAVEFIDLFWWEKYITINMGIYNQFHLNFRERWLAPNLLSQFCLSLTLKVITSTSHIHNIVWGRETCHSKLPFIKENLRKKNHYFYHYYYCCCDLTKGYWMRNNQNGGWKWKGNLYNSNKLQYSPATWRKYPLLVGDYLVTINHPHHNNIQCIYEEWDIPINVHQ